LCPESLDSLQGRMKLSLTIFDARHRLSLFRKIKVNLLRARSGIFSPCQGRDATWTPFKTLTPSFFFFTSRSSFILQDYPRRRASLDEGWIRSVDPFSFLIPLPFPPSFVEVSETDFYRFKAPLFLDILELYVSAFRSCSLTLAIPLQRANSEIDALSTLFFFSRFLWFLTLLPHLAYQDLKHGHDEL